MEKFAEISQCIDKIARLHSVQIVFSVIILTSLEGLTLYWNIVNAIIMVQFKNISSLLASPD